MAYVTTIVPSTTIERTVTAHIFLLPETIAHASVGRLVALMMLTHVLRLLLKGVTA